MMFSPDDSGPIPLSEPDGPPSLPRLPGDVVLRAERDDVFMALAADLMVHAQNCVRAFGDFHLAVNASRNAQAFYLRLMTDPVYRQFPWKRTHVWLTDEPHTDPLDESSAARTVRELLAGPSGLPRDGYHPIEVDRADGAKRYERALQQHLAWRERGHDRLDFVLANVDATPSLAGLTGPSGVVREPERLISEGPAGVTMTMRTIRAARFIALLATGSERAEDVRAVGMQDGEEPSHPAQHLARGEGGAVRWYMDYAAAGG